MDNNCEYLECFSSIVEENEIHSSTSPLGFICIWEELLEELQAGYQYSLYELDYELMIRDDIQTILNSSKLSSYIEFAYFVENIERIDCEIKKIIQIRDTNQWWKGCILKFAGHQYAENVFLEYDISIDIVDK